MENRTDKSTRSPKERTPDGRRRQIHRSGQWWRRRVSQLRIVFSLIDAIAQEDLLNDFLFTTIERLRKPMIKYLCMALLCLTIRIGANNVPSTCFKTRCVRHFAPIQCTYLLPSPDRLSVLQVRRAPTHVFGTFVPVSLEDTKSVVVIPLDRSTRVSCFDSHH